MTNNRNHFLHDCDCYEWVFLGKFTICITWKYSCKVCIISFGFYSSHCKVFITLPFSNTHGQKIAPFSAWLPLSKVILPYWYYENMVLKFLVSFGFYSTQFKFCIYLPESTHRDGQHHNFLLYLYSHELFCHNDTSKIRFNCFLIYIYI